MSERVSFIPQLIVYLESKLSHDLPEKAPQLTMILESHKIISSYLTHMAGAMVGEGGNDGG